MNVPLMTYKSKDYIVRYLAETQESKELQEKSMMAWCMSCSTEIMTLWV